MTLIWAPYVTVYIAVHDSTIVDGAANYFFISNKQKQTKTIPFL